jgi:hypothetical protein
MTTKFTTISCHSQFQPLKEVMLGGVYPENFFNHFNNETQDVMCLINEYTNNDLTQVKKILNDFDINIVEPKFTKVDDYVDDQDNLIRPPITPCDYYIAINNTLYVIPQYESGVDPFQHAIDQWTRNNQKVKVLDRNKPDPMVWCSFASIVRLGQDIIVDFNNSDSLRKKYCLEYINQLSKQYRVHASTTGDHLDSVFCPLRPGVVLSSHYHTKQDVFAGWEVIQLPNKTSINKSLLPDKAQWWLPSVDYMHYNDHVLNVARDWLGQPVETVFDVNNLAIDENNVIMSGCDDITAKKLEGLGITVHLVDLKTKFFWDAGLHCLTRDIHRVGNCENYWPDRPDVGLDWVKHWD